MAWPECGQASARFRRDEPGGGGVPHMYAIDKAGQPTVGNPTDVEGWGSEPTDVTEGRQEWLQPVDQPIDVGSHVRKSRGDQCASDVGE